ncbi:hypothetical protein C1890_27670 [Pseudomonas sp. DP16D-R1]|nr:hypothetical protein C1890_27670 [Pseudomonas sp. DP16D-R1]
MNCIQLKQTTQRLFREIKREGKLMGRRSMIRFFAAYLSICLLLQWAVVQASPWIASRVLLRWIL